MVKLLCRNDIYINTSIEESFCLALAEAIAIGMPSIAMDSVGNREYMDGENAIFVEDAKDFSDKLATMKDVAVRKELHMRAKKSMQRYTLERTIHALKEIIGIG